MKTPAAAHCVLVMFFPFTGCRPRARPQARSAASGPLVRYSVEIRNQSRVELTNASVNYDGFQSIGGVLVPAARKSHHFAPVPPPDTATVVWRTPDGELHSKEVDVPSVSRRYINDGTLVFTIISPYTDAVMVHPEPAPPPGL